MYTANATSFFFNSRKVSLQFTVLNYSMHTKLTGEKILYIKCLNGDYVPLHMGKERD